MPVKSKYFADLRQSYIQDRVTTAENTLNDLELAATRLDDKIIQAQQFIEDGEFIKSIKFKSFLYKIKQSELVLKMKLGESNEKKQELIEKLHAYDPESEVLEEARDLVQRSVMLLVPRWDLEQAFMLDQIRLQESAISYEAYCASGMQR